MQNIPNFNYCYQIMFKSKNSRSKPKKYLTYDDTDTLSASEFSSVTPINSYFEIISAEDCNQYLKIKRHNSDKFIKTTTEQDVGLKLGIDDSINTKIIVSPIGGIGDLGIDIDTIFLPNTNSTKEGNETNIFFNSGKGSNDETYWLSYLILDNNDDLKVCNRRYDECYTHLQMIILIIYHQL